MCSEMKESEYHVCSLWFQIMKSYWTVIQPRPARRTWKRFIWPIQLTGTFSSAQYVKCKPTIFRACIDILRLNIPLLVNITVLIVVKSLPIVFTWGNICSIVADIILKNFLVNKLDYRSFFIHALFWREKLCADLRKYSGNGNLTYSVNQFLKIWPECVLLTKKTWGNFRKYSWR